jgi:hypothetical protein
MTSESQRAEVVRYWWAQAEESLSSARRETAAGAYTFAVKRSYTLDGGDHLSVISTLEGEPRVP